MSPPPPERPRRLPVTPDWLPAVLPAWFPSERLLTAILVLCLVLSGVAFGAGTEPRQIAGVDGGTELSAANVITAGESDSDTAGDIAVVSDPDAVSEEPPTEPGVPDQATTDAAITDDADDELTADEDVANAGEENTAAPDGDAPSVGAETIPLTSNNETLEVAAPPAVPDLGQQDGYILPNYRIVAYYGHPHANTMGILGEYEIEELYEVLMEQVAAWEVADPSKPVIPAFEIIATVAQPDPMSDGSYLLNTDWGTIEKYIEFAEQKGMLVFLDVQVGRRGVQAEVERLLPLLEYPHVHLAIDPEFGIQEGQTPGIHIGSVDASEITWTQNLLADFVTERGLPPKMLIVHQFHYRMIRNKDQLAPVPGVQLIIHADGHGPAPMKRETYNVMVTQEVIEFAGFKVFYPKENWIADGVIMEPEEIMELDPIPDVITYQ